MLDDERYPIPIQPEDQVFYIDEKISPLTVSPKFSFLGSGLHTGRDSALPPGSVGAPPYYQDARLKEMKFTLRESKPAWWKRPTIVLLLVLITLVVVAIICGITYAVNRSHSTTEMANSGSSIPNNTLNSVASSGLFLKDRTTWNMQIYSQTESGDIVYQMSLDGSIFESHRNMTLSVPAKVGSPISATASTDITGVVYLVLFYITASNQIALAGVACPAGSSNCASMINKVISSQITIPPSNNTGLAAVNVNDDLDWRVFYHDLNGMVSQLAGNSTGFDKGQIIGGTAFNGTSIAATNVNSTTNNINVFYVDSSTQNLFTLEFTSEWTIPSAVSLDISPSWNPYSGLAACYSTVQDQIRTYYTGLDLKIYEFEGSNASSTRTSWAVEPGQNPVWINAPYIGADITAVGWENQIRFFQPIGKRIAQASLSDTTWTEAFLLNT